MSHEIKKYNGNNEICCKYKKEGYGTIYFLKGEVGENDVCKICGKRLKE